METKLICVLDNNEVYKDKRYEIRVKMKNTAEQAWIMTSESGEIIVSLPIGEENADIAKTDEGMEITCGDLEVKWKETGKWILYPREEKYILEPGQELSFKVSGENPSFSKTDTNYMSGILISYPEGEKTQNVCLPVYKVCDKLAICIFSVKGKNAKSESGNERTYEIEYGEEITLQWEITRGGSYCVAPYNWKREGEQEKTVTLWHDTVFSLCASDDETFLRQDILIKVKPPGDGSFKSVTAELQKEKAVINVEYKNASFSYLDRGVGKVGALVELTDYDIGENYFLQFPEQKGVKGHVQIKGTETKQPRVDYFRYYYFPKNRKEERYYAEWNITGSNGKLYIEREGKTCEYPVSGCAYFTDTAKENALINISTEDESENKIVYHDIYPYEL